MSNVALVTPKIVAPTGHALHTMRTPKPALAKTTSPVTREAVSL